MVQDSDCDVLAWQLQLKSCGLAVGGRDEEKKSLDLLNSPFNPKVNNDSSHFRRRDPFSPDAFQREREREGEGESVDTN
jgi:hypothetical protein